ncbi:MAG: methylmalonyl-CoA carboxyltransferase [Chloroflexi bacterium]|nr:methylmalonyl-CoA carboxyltransferase [Chloroflexota bacterium]
MVWEPEIEELERRRALGRGLGGEDRIQQQHDAGKLTVRERIDLLADPGTFREFGVMAGTAEYEDNEIAAFYPQPFVTGIIQVDGREVVVGGGDYTSRGAPRANDRSVNKSTYAEQMALDLSLPIVRLIDAFGADIRAIESIGRTYIPANPNFEVVARQISEVPVVSVALGAVAGWPAAQMAASHFSVMVREMSQVFAAGPPVVERALGMPITKEELGGYLVHARQSGLVDNDVADEAEALTQVRRFLSYLPTNVWEAPLVLPCDDPADRREAELLSLIPRDRRRPYDARKMVALIMDRDSTFELGRYFGRSLVTMFARLDGHPVGVLANDPRQYGGSMDAAAAQKMEKFVDLCDTFHLPVINFVDQPGFMVGPESEASGTLKHGVRAIAAVYASSVPWASVIVRRVYGVAGAGHQDHSRTNFRIAWPSGEWGSLPIEGGVMAAYRRQIESAEDPQAARAEIEERLIALRSPFRTAEAFNIEDIIDPRETRPELVRWVRLSWKKIPSLLGKRGRGMRP